MKGGMKATSLRSLLIFVIVLMIAAIAGGFYYGLQQVRTFAVTVSHTTADANASDQQILELQELKNALSERESLVTKANQVFSSEANYQSQALRDVQRYASAYGMTIENTNFEEGANGSSASRDFTITLASPSSYTGLLKFLNAIEGNLPKMQITSISFERPENGSAAEINTGNILISISTRAA